MDPQWAILTDPKGKFGKWDLDEFFATGENQMANVLAMAEGLGYPKQRETALDFGCGVGRLTRGMAKYFTHCHGIDISESMIAKAKELNQAFPNCQFTVNFADHLRVFPDSQFDLIYTAIVLQHLPTRVMIKSYIADKVHSVAIAEETFEPRFPVELTKSGGYFGKPYFSGADVGTFTSRRVTTRSAFAMEYTVECPYCNKRFKRSKYNTKLNEHKDRYGNRCYGRVGYMV